MNTLMNTVIPMAVAYAVMAFIKFMLMASNAHVAAGVHQRLGQRQGYTPYFIWCYGIILVALIPICLLGWPRSLMQEKFAFFRLYSRREIIRDVIHTSRLTSGN
jgi:hypothetical protein